MGDAHVRYASSDCDLPELAQAVSRLMRFDQEWPAPTHATGGFR
jgi:hypothetical protein